MLKSNLTSKTFDFATQTPKLRKTTSISFFIRSPGYFLLFFIIFLIFPVQGIAGSALAKSGAVKSAMRHSAALANPLKSSPFLKRLVGG